MKIVITIDIARLAIGTALGVIGGYKCFKAGYELGKYRSENNKETVNE